MNACNNLNSYREFFSPLLVLIEHRPFIFWSLGNWRPFNNLLGCTKWLLFLFFAWDFDLARVPFLFVGRKNWIQSREGILLMGKLALYLKRLFSLCRSYLNFCFAIFSSQSIFKTYSELRWKGNIHNIFYWITISYPKWNGCQKKEKKKISSLREKYVLLFKLWNDQKLSFNLKSVAI